MDYQRLYGIDGMTTISAIFTNNGLFMMYNRSAKRPLLIFGTEWVEKLVYRWTLVFK